MGETRGGTSPVDGDVQRAAFVGELVAETIHDVNNWLQIITGLAQIEVVRTCDTRTRDALAQIDAAGKLAGRMTRALLRVARSAGREEPGDVTESVRTILEMFAHRFTGPRACEVTWRKTSSLLPVALSTSNVDLVMCNILKNALDALAAVDDRRIRVTTSLERERGRAVIEVWNSGERISDDALPQIFEAYHSTKPADRGTGLGLSTCRRLLESVGGCIRARNDSPVGVCFTVEIPLATARPSPASAEPRRAVRALIGRRVLLVDDDAQVRQAVGLIAAEIGGAEVVTCSSGEDALAVLARDSFDAVILDLRMPGISGEDVYRALPDDVKARIIFLTGDTVNRATTDFLSSTHRPALFKPVDSTEVIGAVGQILGYVGR